jgi:rRNA-processing protein FCF1
MRDFAQQLEHYRARGAVVDTNLLLLLFLGSYERKHISQGRLTRYTPEDFELLVRLLDRFQKIITTPHILTEVSNLSNAIVESERAAYFLAFADRLALLSEEYVGSATPMKSRWAEFGLTDAAIGVIAQNKYLVITDDFRLSQKLQFDGIDSLNFNHIRQMAWQLMA